MVAVLVIDEVADAVPLARTLLEGGISAMELTLRTPAALDALRMIRSQVPEMTAGVGTVLTREQVRGVKAAGAAFGVAPGLNPSFLQRRLKLPEIDFFGLIPAVFLCKSLIFNAGFSM